LLKVAINGEEALLRGAHTFLVVFGIESFWTFSWLLQLGVLIIEIERGREGRLGGGCYGRENFFELLFLRRENENSLLMGSL
jgi:hypothetical protein